MLALNDKDFLYALDRQKNKKIFVRITLLTFNELPIEAIEGRVSTGSISVDGDSAVRRTCSLTLIRDDAKMLDYNWSLNKKVKIEVGVQNLVNSKYSDIIWFPQGIFILTGLQQQLSTNGATISISGKDKMCLLNGDIGGQIPHSVKASQIEHEQYLYTPITVSGIQYNIDNSIPQQYYYKRRNRYILDNDVVAHLNKYEHYTRDISIIYEDIEIKDIIRNIVIKFGNERMENIIINDFNDNSLELLTYHGSQSLYLFKDLSTGNISDMTIDPSHIVYVNRTAKEVSSFEDSEYDLLIQYVDDITPTVVKMTRNGSKTYTIVRLQMGDVAGYRPTPLTYPGKLVTKVGDTVVSILNELVKVLGAYEFFYDVNGRFIFQKKKIYSQTNWDPLITTQEDETYVENLALAKMSSYSFDDGLLLTAFNNTPKIDSLRNDFSIWGERTTASGVKLLIHYRYAIAKKPTYYKSIDGTVYKSSSYDWRELIYRMAEDYYAYAMQDPTFFQQVAANNLDSNGDTIYPSGYTGYEPFYEDLLGFWRDVYSADKKWSDEVKTNPEMLNFWFDFLDNTSTVGKYTVQSIGDRTKAINDSKVTTIYSRGIPDVLFVSNDEYEQLVEQEKLTSAYTYLIMTSSLLDSFTTTGTYKSAKEVLDDTINTYTLCAESASITILPIYHLEPNSIISIHDEVTGIAGEYVVTKFSVPLTHNGTMSLTATKKVDVIY